MLQDQSMLRADGQDRAEAAGSWTRQGYDYFKFKLDFQDSRA